MEYVVKVEQFSVRTSQCLWADWQRWYDCSVATACFLFVLFVLMYLIQCSKVMQIKKTAWCVENDGRWIKLLSSNTCVFAWFSCMQFAVSSSELITFTISVVFCFRCCCCIYINGVCWNMKIYKTLSEALKLQKLEEERFRVLPKYSYDRLVWTLTMIKPVLRLLKYWNGVTFHSLFKIKL